MTIDINQSIADWKKNKLVLLSLKDLILTETVSGFIKNNQHMLHGEYDLYTIYEKENKQRYALIYAEYEETGQVSEESFEEIVNNDTRYLHQKMKEENIPLNYLFVVAYFNYEQRIKGSITYASCTEDIA